MKEELLEDYMNYQGDFVMEGFFPDLFKTLFPSEKEAPEKAHAASLHTGGSWVENIQDHLWGNPKIQTLGRLTARHVVRLSLCCSVNKVRGERVRWENSISVNVNVSSEALQEKRLPQEWEGGRHHMLGRKKM